ncbi:MAG: hypothetical protein AcusKO_45720 [Acuticoccus sp.]
MKFYRLYNDDAGESHFTDVDVSLAEKSFAPPARSIEVSRPEPARQMLFLRLPAGWDEPVHPTPVRQKLICLAGAVRVTASDGTTRDIAQGDVLHMEDRHGKGHHTRVVGDADFEAVVVQFD